jgi:glucose-6-phosphate isomerase
MIQTSPLKFSLRTNELAFDYGPGITGPSPEFRTLDAIRQSLLEPDCSGPDPVYAIAMDVARDCDLPMLKDRMLLYGIVAYAAGRLGREPPRSQGHVHSVSPHSGWSSPELFEIIEGEAIIYAQQSTQENPGRCVAVVAHEGNKVVVPPSWAHCVINANPADRMVFGAWCDRQYGFIYDGIRRHRGLAWFPVLSGNDEIEWIANTLYRGSELDVHTARSYPELDLAPDRNLYQQFLDNPDSIMWVSDPLRKAAIWTGFAP